MKRFLAVLFFLIAPVVFSGCSLNSSDVSGKKGSIWKSVDGGKTWEATKSSEKADLSVVDALSMAINPYDSKNIFVGTKGGGILMTGDGGESWEYLNFQPEKVYGLAVDPLDGRIIYASGVWQKRGKIFKSADSGKTWKEIYTVASAGPLVISLAIDKKNPRILYATTSDNQVIKTQDGGETWKNIFEAPSPVLQVSIDSVNSNLVYLNVASKGIWRSRNGGENPEDISRQVFALARGGQEISIIKTDPTSGNWIYAAGAIGMLRSRDGGNSWEKIEILNNPQNFPVKSLAINPRNSKEIVYGAAQTAYRSSDGGTSWTPSQLETSKRVNILEYDPADPSILYLGLSK